MSHSWLVLPNVWLCRPIGKVALSILESSTWANTQHVFHWIRTHIHSQTSFMSSTWANTQSIGSYDKQPDYSPLYELNELNRVWITILLAESSMSWIEYELNRVWVEWVESSILLALCMSWIEFHTILWSTNRRSPVSIKELSTAGKCTAVKNTPVQFCTSSKLSSLSLYGRDAVVHERRGRGANLHFFGPAESIETNSVLGSCIHRQS